jgi:zinc protease
MDLRSFSHGIALCGVLAASLLIAGPAMANPYETTLPNGLRVIVKEDRRAPVAVHMVWYRVGAMDEKDGTTGVAHLLEHMMFKGTKKLKPGEFNEIVARAGGSDNAFTSQDYTAYFQRVPAAALPRMIELEADRMRNLVINDDEFERELKVVMEERRLRTDDKPQAQVYEQLMASAFTAHPYRRPIIGWMNDLENMRPDDARDWYHRWYAPNNAYVVVVGDVDHKAVFSLVKKHYGRMKAEPLPVRKTTAEPLQTGQRRVVVKAPAEVPQIVMAWKVPRLIDVKAIASRTRSMCWPAFSMVTRHRDCRAIWCAAVRSRPRSVRTTTRLHAGKPLSYWVVRRPGAGRSPNSKRRCGPK